jgi:FkbM family methyltransferase
MILGFSDYESKYDFSNVRGVIHVGAHHGQEYQDYQDYFHKDIIIYWFEPIRESYEKLVQNIGTCPNNYFYNLGLGSANSKKKIWKDSGNEGQSSSFLKPSKHLEIFPHITFEPHPEEIEIFRLDDLHIRNANVLVLDTQGYELEVLKGSSETLGFLDHIFCEVNSDEVYEGCPSLYDIDMFLQSHGFTLKENWWTAQKWGDCYWSRAN